MFGDVQLGFFDFDRTLYAYPFPYVGEVHGNYYDQCMMNLTKKAQEDRVGKGKPVACMKWLSGLLKDNQVPMYVLTHEIFNLRDEWKASVSKKEFGIENYLTVDSPEHKVDMIKAVATVHNVPLKNCLFVDDKMDTIYLACREGIFGLHSSNIAQLYEDIKK